MNPSTFREAKRQLFSCSVKAARALYGTTPLDHVRASLWNHIAEQTELDDQEYDPYREIATLLDMSLLDDPRPMARISPDHLTELLCRLGWKIFQGAGLAGSGRWHNERTRESITWSVIVLSGGAFDTQYVFMELPLKCLVHCVSAGFVEREGLGVLRDMAVLLSYTCPAIAWMECMILLRLVNRQLGDGEDVRGLLLNRMAAGQDATWLLRWCPPRVTMSELELEYEDTFKAIADPGLRADASAHLGHMCQYVRECVEPD